jgi:hypothetical protein
MTKAIDQRYFIYPEHGATNVRTSGTKMAVILGPDAGESTNYGAAPYNSISGHMGKLNEKDYTYVGSGTKGLWVAGHLLNDNLGGSGTDAKNLTPLTQTANKQHSAYEQKIKSAITCCRQLRDNYPKVPFFVGIHYEVFVSAATFGDDKPYNKAPSHISIRTTLVKADKKTLDITFLTIPDWPPIPSDIARSLKAAVFSADIHNHDLHLTGCVNPDCEH